MARAVRLTVRLPKEVSDRIDALNDWILNQPELALARRSTATVHAYVMMKGLEAVEAELAKQQRAHQLADQARLEQANLEKLRLRHDKQPTPFDPESGPTISLGHVYNEWASLSTDDDKKPR